jgi:hypothetical protein
MNNVYQPYFKNKSELKTKLKRAGFKLENRNIHELTYKNRKFRLQFNATVAKIHVSCPLEEFDRWANSTAQEWSPELLVDFLSGKCYGTQTELFNTILEMTE